MRSLTTPKEQSASTWPPRRKPSCRSVKYVSAASSVYHSLGKRRRWASAAISRCTILGRFIASFIEAAMIAVRFVFSKGLAIMNWPLPKQQLSLVCAQRIG
jgi:hypothetical protein